MISVINRDYKYEKVNTTFCNNHLKENDSIVGKSLSDVWGYDTFRNKIKPFIDQCFSGQTVKYEASFNMHQPGEKYFEVVFRPISLDSDDITHLIAETIDITEQRLSEKTATKIKEEFTVFETYLPIGFLRCDRDGRIINANKAFLKIMECSDEESIIGKDLRSFYSEKDIFDLHIDQLLSGRTRNFGRIDLKTLKENEIACRISGFMALDDLGYPKLIDFALEDLSRELLLENRLLQAQKLETIGALAGGIAHDFNNLLATISGYSELLQDDLPKSSESFGMVSKILSAVSKARSLTNQILTFSRQVEQEKVVVNVSDVLIETIGFVKSLIPSNISINSLPHIENATVFADPTQLFRVFLNLMTNAIQAMEESGGTLSVALDLVEGKHIEHLLNKAIVADEYVNVTVKDTGKGMGSSLVNRIFEPYFTTREVGKGTGLGLSVVHGIISEMEGEILVSSQENLGSQFFVYLPVSKEDKGISDDQDERKKILFLTGNKYESRILSLALESSGYGLMYASDRIHLKKILSDINQKPDLIIYMNDSEQVNTEELIGLFLKLKINVPCILITDTEQKILEEKLVNSGIFKQYLLKPVSLKELKSAVKFSIKY
jgi:signal transduction histidine kinase/CheY-like chemotaxis protein